MILEIKQEKVNLLSNEFLRCCKSFDDQFFIFSFFIIWYFFKSCTYYKFIFSYFEISIWNDMYNMLQMNNKHIKKNILRIFMK